MEELTHSASRNAQHLCYLILLHQWLLWNLVLTVVELKYLLLLSICEISFFLFWLDTHDALIIGHECHAHLGR